MELKAPDMEGILDFKRKQKHLSEAQIQREIIEYLRKSNDVFAWRQNSIGVPTTGGVRKPPPQKGVSDILAVVKPSGRFLAIEVKSPTGVLNEGQAAFLDSVKKAGGETVVARSVEDVMKVLAQMTYKGPKIPY